MDPVQSNTAYDLLQEKDNIIEDLEKDIERKRSQMYVSAAVALKNELRCKVLIKKKEICEKEKIALRETLTQNLIELQKEKAKRCDFELLNVQLMTQIKAKPKMNKEKQKIGTNLQAKPDLPFVCTIDGCNKSYARKDSFNRHKLRHTKNFVCDICNEKFSQISDIKRHMSCHTKDLPFSCEKCEYKSRQKTNLTRHMKIHHKKML